MGANKDRRRAQGGQLGEQLLAIFHVGIIGLVMAEEAPDGTEFAFGFGSVDTNCDGELRGLWVGIWLPGICPGETETKTCYRNVRQKLSEGDVHLLPPVAKDLFRGDPHRLPTTNLRNTAVKFLFPGFSRASVFWLKRLQNGVCYFCPLMLAE